MTNSIGGSKVFGFFSFCSGAHLGIYGGVTQVIGRQIRQRFSGFESKDSGENAQGLPLKDDRLDRKGGGLLVTHEIGLAVDDLRQFK